VRTLFIKENLCFIGSTINGSHTSLLLLDVTDPVSPTHISTYTTLGNVMDIYVNESLVFYSTWEYGFEIINYENTSSPYFLSSYNSVGSSSDIIVEGSVLYEAAVTGGLKVIDFSNFSQPIELGHYFDGGQALGLCLRDDLIYVADKSGGLEILEIKFNIIGKTSAFTFFIVLAVFPVYYFYRRRFKRS